MSSLRGMGRDRATDDLLEREAELAALDGALTEAQRGTGTLVVVEGPAGVGKSRLLAAAGHRARSRGMHAQWATATALERDFGFGVVLQLFERAVHSAGSAERARLLSGAAGLVTPLFLPPNGHAGPGVDETHNLVRGLFWLTANLSGPEGLVLLIDDAHWADPPSLRFLAYLLARLEELPMAVVVALRPGEPGADVDVAGLLDAGARSRRLRPQALSRAAVETMVRTHGFPDAEDCFCVACASVTGGNPFLLRALLADARASGLRPDASGADRLSRLAPEAVAQSLRSRLARLPARAPALARAVAILGEGAELRLAATLAGVSLEEAAKAADALSQAQILRLGQPLGFVHTLVAAVVAADLPPAEAACAHGRAARLLGAEGASPERIAGHLLAAQPAGDPWAVTVLDRVAAEALANGAPAVAARYLGRALEEPPPTELRPHLLVELGRAQISIGAPEAPRVLSEAVELLADGTRRAEACRLLAAALAVQGRHDDAATALTRGLSEIRSGGDEHADETFLERTLLAQLAVQRAVSARPREEVAALAQRAWEGGALLAAEGPDGLSWPNVTSSLTFVGEWEASEAICTAVSEEAARRGSPMALAMAAYYRSLPQLLRGQVLDAMADAQQALGARAHGWRAHVGAARAVLALALIEQGDLDGAEKSLGTVEDFGHGQSFERALLLEARGRLRSAQGRLAEALADYLEAGRFFEETGTPVVSTWRSGAALASARLGDLARARALVEHDRDRADAVGAGGPIGRTLRVAGEIETDAPRAIDLLEQAVNVLAASPARLEETEARLALGTVLNRTGQRGEARRQLTPALEMAHRLGAARLESDLRHELVLAGSRPRRVALTGRHSLTASELRVAEMASRGLSNREIAQSLYVTTKAVEWHLGHAYRKLGVRSRENLGSVLGENPSHEPRRVG